MNLWQRVSDKVKELVSSLPYKKEGGEKFVPPKSRVIRKNYVKAVRSGLFAALKSKNQERILEFIETEEFDLEEVDAISGLTPLLFALKYEQWAAVEKLLELGANVNFKTNCGRYSAVGLAFEGKNVALAKRLLEKGAPIFVEPSAGAYEIEPLYHGVLSDDLGLMKWMLERVVSEKGFDSSRRSSFENVLGEYMGFAKSKDMIRLLLEYGGDINQGNFLSGMTPLMRMTYRQEVELVMFLLDNGANPNEAISSYAIKIQKLNALMMAAGLGNLELVRILTPVTNLDAVSGEDADLYGTVEPPDHGQTALSYAVVGGFLDVAKFLIDSGHRLDILDEKWNTTLYAAVDSKSLAMVKLLLPYYPNFRDKDQLGNNILTYTKDRHPEIHNYLLTANPQLYS